METQDIQRDMNETLSCFEPRIDPETGKVVGWIDLSGLLPEQYRAQPVDVLNGIAYDKDNDRLFVTGKLWPRIFEIRLKKRI